MVAPNGLTHEVPYSTFLSPQVEVAIESLQATKNEIIGHPERKSQAVRSGILPILLKVLGTTTNAPEARVQAAIVLASLCQTDLKVATSLPDAVISDCEPNIEQQVIGSLLFCISEDGSPPMLVLTCLRALNSLVARGVDALAIWSHRPLSCLIQILQAAATSAKSIIYEQAGYAAALLATYSEEMNVDNLNAELAHGALLGIVVNITQLGHRPIDLCSPFSKLLESSLCAIAALTRTNPTLSTQLAVAGRLSQYRCTSDDGPMITTLLRLVRHQSSAVRLGSSSCLTNLFKHGSIPRRHHKEIASTVLPTLVRLFDDAVLKSQACYVLTDLIKDSDEMQRAACDAKAIQKLSGILQEPPEPYHERTLESALLAVAAITLHKDEYRKLVIEAKVVPLIVSSMSHSAPSVRAAACQCARSLSRSVAMLRTSLIDAGVATAVFNLMSDADLNVKTSATAAVCNLVLDFSPMRGPMLQSGLLPLLGNLSQDENAELRLNAVWAIKHIVCAADVDIKANVLTQVTSALLLKLCDDREIAIQEQACEIIRNVVCGKPESIDLLIESIGIERLCDFLIRKLHSPHSEIVVSAVYSLVHIAAGSERHRMILMQRSAILESLHLHLGSEVAKIRLGAVWTIINLTWQEDETTASERRARINALESLGLLERLHQLESDRSPDVRERVKTALGQMQ